MTKSITKSNQKSITEKTAVINISSPKAMATFAKELKQFVVDSNLYTGISNKNYVHVEGWQFAGASMGIFPIIKSLDNQSSENEIKYRAEVELVRLSDSTVVGYGIAICSNKEKKKRDFDEYAIASMAQTRATGKAFRMTIGWVMKLAGYEATPAEEADELEKSKLTNRSASDVDGRASVKQKELAFKIIQKKGIVGTDNIKQVFLRITGLESMLDMTYDEAADAIDKLNAMTEEDMQEIAKPLTAEEKEALGI